MKKLFILLTILVSCVVAQAQWSVGLDARIAPWNTDNRNYGTDIVVNYQLNAGGLFVLPSAGLFYKCLKEEDMYLGLNGPSPHTYSKNGYQTGFDVGIFIGKEFSLGPGALGIFTGPRYGYAFISDVCDPVNRNSLDWRIGVSYRIWKITASVKCDIGCLKYASYYNHRQVSTLAIGVAYNL